LNSGGGSCLFSSHVFSLVVGSIVASVAVFCLRVVILFLKYLLKIVAIFSGLVTNSGESSPSSWCTITEGDRFLTVPNNSLAVLHALDESTPSSNPFL
jgi:glucan phosphoethanolaminetransferase (alkaline phosphatase superfamily)